MDRAIGITYDANRLLSEPSEVGLRVIKIRTNDSGNEIYIHRHFEEWKSVREDSIRRVSDTNGTLHLGENTEAWQDLY